MNKTFQVVVSDVKHNKIRYKEHNRAAVEEKPL